MDKTKFGSFVAQSRKDLGLTQKMLAEKLHVTDKAVSKWERGLSYPDVTLLEPLSDALGLELGELISCKKESRDASENTFVPTSVCKNDNGSQISDLLDISKESLRWERTRRKIWFIFIGAILFSLLATLAVMASQNIITECSVLRVLHTEETDDTLLLYFEKDGHLLCLCYKTEDDRDLLAEQIEQNHYIQAEYRWNRKTLQGELLSWKNDKDTIILGSPLDEIGSSTDLYTYDGDALFGYSRVMMRIDSRTPNPSGSGYLSTYTFFAGDDSEDWYLHANEELIRVSDCVGYGCYGDIGFCTLDVDDDGIRELLVRTIWPEKPCIIFDKTESGIEEIWLDEVPDIMQETSE